MKGTPRVSVFRLLGSPTILLGVVERDYQGQIKDEPLTGDFFIEDHVRMIEMMTAQNSDFQFRSDPMFPSDKPAKMSKSSIGYQRELNPDDREDQGILKQYEDRLQNIRALKSGIKLA